MVKMMNLGLKKALPIAALTLLASVGSGFAQDAKTNKQTDLKVQNIYETLYAGNCRSLMEGNTPHQPTIHEFTFNYKDENFRPRPYRLYEFLCFEGPYNWGSVYFGADEYQEVKHISFAVPTFDVTYENNDSYGAVESINVTGFSTTDQLFDANYDPQTKTISSFSKWRGPADAFSSGVWKFIDGEFMLQEFEVDAAYDGERNPTVIYGDGLPRLYDEGEDQ